MLQFGSTDESQALLEGKGHAPGATLYAVRNVEAAPFDIVLCVALPGGPRATNELLWRATHAAATRLNRSEFDPLRDHPLPEEKAMAAANMVATLEAKAVDANKPLQASFTPSEAKLQYANVPHRPAVVVGLLSSIDRESGVQLGDLLFFAPGRVFLDTGARRAVPHHLARCAAPHV